MAIVTPTEARKLWCPFARALGGNGAAVNRGWLDDEEVAGVSCLADKCMAWEWFGAVPANDSDARGRCALTHLRR